MSLRTQTPKRAVLGLITAAVAACVLAACGSSSLSHKDLVARANSACLTANQAVSKLGAPTASLSALKGYATKMLPISQKLVTKLSGLDASSSDQSSLNGLVAALKNGNKGLSAMSSATTIAQTTAATKLIVAKSVPQAANKLGATTCAVSPSA